MEEGPCQYQVIPREEGEMPGEPRACPVYDDRKRYSFTKLPCNQGEDFYKYARMRTGKVGLWVACSYPYKFKERQ